MINDQFLVMRGGAIKALGESASKGKLGGVLCRFSTANDPDRTEERDFFDEQTEFGFYDGMKSPIYFHHGLDESHGVKQYGFVVLGQTANGIEIVDSEIDTSTPAGAKMYQDAAKGLLGWSSGTAAHLVKRTPRAAKNGAISNHIDYWPLGLDASLTPIPAEPRNVAVALKSLVETLDGTFDVPVEVAGEMENLRAGADYAMLREMQVLEIAWKQRRLIEAQMDVLKMQHDVLTQCL